jgi:hypothetical protein
MSSIARCAPSLLVGRSQLAAGDVHDLADGGPARLQRCEVVLKLRVDLLLGEVEPTLIGGARGGLGLGRACPAPIALGLMPENAAEFFDQPVAEPAPGRRVGNLARTAGPAVRAGAGRDR